MDRCFLLLQTGVEAESATCVIELADAGGTGDHALSEPACPSGAQPEAQAGGARGRAANVHSEAQGRRPQDTYVGGATWAHICWLNTARMVLHERETVLTRALVVHRRAHAGGRRDGEGGGRGGGARQAEYGARGAAGRQISADMYVGRAQASARPGRVKQGRRRRRRGPPGRTRRSWRCRRPRQC